MTKTEFLNDLIYDMAGYLDTSGVDRLKNMYHTVTNKKECDFD